MISLVRVDDRLIHGQVVTQWVKHTNANRIYIVDDTVHADEFMRKMMIGLAPSGIDVKVVTVENACANMNRIVDNSEINAIILVKGPEPILEMLKAGVRLDHLILGGMGANKERTRISRAVALSDSEVSTIREILTYEIPVSTQIVPYQQKDSVESLIEGR